MSLQLKVVADGQISYLRLSDIHMVYYAKPGAVYTLVDGNGNTVTENLELRHHRDKLEIIHEDRPVAVIEDFYAASETPAVYSVDGAVDSTVTNDELLVVGGNTRTEPGVVWNSEIATIDSDAVVDDVVALEPVESVATVSIAEDVVSIDGASDKDPILAGTVSNESQIVDSSNPVVIDVGDDSDSSSNGFLYTTLGIVGAAGVAALAGGSSGGSSSSPAATISIDSITADNTINNAESTSNITVTGSVSGVASQGDTVTLTVGNTSYTGIVGSDLTYAIVASGSVLAANTSISASVTGTDNAGNTVTANGSKSYSVNATGASATISIDSITADNTINDVESSSNINITGTAGGDAAEGDTVTLTVGDITYTGTVGSNLAYSIVTSGSVLAANTEITATVTGIDDLGDAFTQSETMVYTVDTNAPSISSSATATSISEGASATDVYTIIATDASTGELTYALSDNSDGDFTISGNVVTFVGTATAGTETFEVTATDEAGNTSESKEVTLTINDLQDVVFDLSTGDSTSDGGTFASNVAYTIYIVAGNYDNLGVETWSAAGNLSNDDNVILVGSSDDIWSIDNIASGKITWTTTSLGVQVNPDPIADVWGGTFDEIADNLTYATKLPDGISV